ncbi:MAG: hypothetical protein CR992_00710 [Desulfobacterales bacterium]|nr:MAG: hypothetical protein CR992_00710 [Desulfobacterales bacterium]
MRFHLKKDKKRIYRLLVTTVLAIMPTVVNGAAPDLFAPSDFEYVLADRADPFMPFITEKSATSDIDMNEIVDPEEPLTGMQLFEPGQLTLVALMDTGGRSVAMAEDFTGKGYVLTEGMKIGKRGTIVRIAANSVFIEETARTRAGKEIVTEVVMTLKNNRPYF